MRRWVLLSLSMMAMALSACGHTASATGCRVTRPITPTAQLVEATRSDTRWYGRDGLWVSLPTPNTRPDRQPNGLLHLKIAWWRLTPGNLSENAIRLDVPGRAAAQVPSGNGMTGLQPTGVLFPKPGCWEVQGRVNTTTVTIVVKVRPA